MSKLSRLKMFEVTLETTIRGKVYALGTSVSDCAVTLKRNEAKGSTTLIAENIDLINQEPEEVATRFVAAREIARMPDDADSEYEFWTTLGAWSVFEGKPDDEEQDDLIFDLINGGAPLGEFFKAKSSEAKK